MCFNMYVKQTGRFYTFHIDEDIYVKRMINTRKTYVAHYRSCGIA